MFRQQNPVLPASSDGLGMGVGFTAALLAMGIIRELLPARVPCSALLLSNFMDPIIIFPAPPGGFFVFGILIAIAGKLSAEGASAGIWAALHARWRLLLQGSGKM